MMNAHNEQTSGAQRSGSYTFNNSNTESEAAAYNEAAKRYNIITLREKRRRYLALPRVRHEHICEWCECRYSHMHRKGEIDHDQRPNQCPNWKCPQYTNGWADMDEFELTRIQTENLDNTWKSDEPELLKEHIPCRCGAWRVNTNVGEQRHIHEPRFHAKTHRLNFEFDYFIKSMKCRLSDQPFFNFERQVLQAVHAWQHDLDRPEYQEALRKANEEMEERRQRYIAWERNTFHYGDDEEPLQAEAQMDRLNFFKDERESFKRVSGKVEVMTDSVTETTTKVNSFLDSMENALTTVTDTIESLKDKGTGFFGTGQVFSLLMDIFGGAYTSPKVADSLKEFRASMGSSTNIGGTAHPIPRLVLRILTIFGIAPGLVAQIVTKCKDAIVWLMDCFSTKTQKEDNSKRAEYFVGTMAQFEAMKENEARTRIDGRRERLREDLSRSFAESLRYRSRDPNQPSTSRVDDDDEEPESTYFRATKQAENNSLLSLITATVGTAILGFLPDDKTMKTMNDKLRFFNFVVPTIGKVEELVTYFFNLIPISIKQWMCVMCPSEKLATMLFDTNGEVRKWLIEVDALDVQKANIVREFSLQERALKAREFGTTLQSELATTMRKEKETSKLYTLVLRYQTIAKALGDAVDKIRQDKGVRPTPFCLYITGDPGVGKSTIAKTLVQAVIPKDYNPNHAIYSRNSSSKFWDKYSGQFCVLNDDFFQDRNATDVAEAICMISNNTYFPEFASMTDPSMGIKGTAFNSSLVMLLSNAPYPDVTNENIRNKGAFLRRRHILLQMVAKPEAMKNPAGQTETQRMVRDECRDIENWKHVEFHILDPMESGTRPLHVFNYEEFVLFFMKSYYTHTKRELEALGIQMKAVSVKSIREKFEAENEALIAEPQAWWRNPFTDKKEKTGNDGYEEEYHDAHDGNDDEKIQKMIEEFELGVDIEAARLKAETEKAKYPKLKLLAWISGLCAGVGGAVWILYKLYKHFTGPMPSTKQSYSERTAHRRGAEKRRGFIAQSANDWRRTRKDLEDIRTAFPDLTNVAEFILAAKKFDEEAVLALAAIDRGEDELDWVKRMDLANTLLKEELDRYVPDWTRVLVDLVGNDDFADWDKNLSTVVESLYARSSGPTNQMRTEYERTNKCLRMKDRAAAILSASSLLGLLGREREMDIDLLTDAARLGMLTATRTALKSEANGTTDQQAMDLLNNVFCKHMCSLDLPINGSRLCGMMVGGSVVMAPRHFFSDVGGVIKDGTCFDWKPAEGGAPIRIAFRKEMFSPLYDTNGELKDVVLYDLGKAVRSYSDITCHFPSLKDLHKYTHLNGLMVIANFISPMIVQRSVRDIKYITEVKTKGAIYDSFGETYRSIDSWLYTGETALGDCGAPILALNPKLPQKLIGVHTISVNGSGYSGGEIVAREYIEMALKKLPSRILKNPVLPELGSLENATPYLEATMQGHTHLTLHGTLDGKRVTRGATKTRIIKSPLYGKVAPSTKEPAALTPNDPRVLPEYRESPLIRGIESFGKTGGDPPRPDYVKMAIEHVKNKVLSFCSSDPRFIATEQQAINGMHFSHCDSLNMKSSAGYPYNLERTVGSSGKNSWIAGEIGDLRVVNPMLRQRIDERIASFGRREMVTSTWTASLKDELRPVEKIKVNKTRTFIMGPLDNTLVSRMYLLAFNSALFRNHSKKGFFYAPGIDPQSTEWDALYRDLLEMSDIGFSGDYGRYDSTLQPELMDGVRQIANAFYENDPSEVYRDTLEARNIRDCLFHEYIHTTIIVGNIVCQKHRGNPSGCNCTTSNNGIYNEILACYIWLCTAPDELKDLIFYEANVRTKNFGDDVVFAVTPRALTFYNAATYAAQCAKLGMEFTNADKTNEIKPVERLCDMTFLKQGFTLKNGFYVATLDKLSINEMFNWITDTNETWEAVEENAAAALRYAWAYGPDYFNELRQKAILEATKLGHFLKLPQYEFFSTAYAKTGGLYNLAYDPYDITTYQEIERDDLRATAQSDTRGKMGNGEHDEPMGGKPGEIVTDQGDLGIVQIEQTEVVTVEKPRASDKDELAQASAPDFNWTMASTVAKPHLVKTGQWSTTDAYLSLLETFLLPQDMISGDSVAHTPFSLHAYWRGKIEVHVSITGTKFNTGRLIMYWVPLCRPNYANVRTNSTKQWTSLTHVFLDPADNSGGKLVIPFCHPHGFLNIREPAPIDMLGTLSMRVANVLRVGAGQPTSVGYSVTVRFLESTFMVQIPTDILPARISQTKLDARRKRAERELELIQRLELERMDVRKKREADDEPFEATAQGNMITKNYNLSHSIMKVEGNETQTSENELTATVPAGLDYPNVNLQGHPVRRVGMGNFTNADNLDFNERLALHPGDAKNLTTSETFATEQDEMSIPYLCSIPNWESVIPWSSSNAAGTLLQWGWMCPLSDSLAGHWNLSPAPNGTNNPFYFVMTSRDWATAKFTYWQGSLKLRLQLIASMYHTGKLFVSLMYGVYNQPAGLTLEQVTSTKGFYIDINSTKHDFEFTMDWLNPKPWLKVPRGPVPQGTEQLEFAMGTWSIWVVEPLRMGPGVADAVDINWWTYSGEDYQVSLLSNNNGSMIAADGNSVQDFGASRGGPPLQATKQSQQTMGASDSTMDGPAHPINTNGERIHSITDIFKRRVIFTSQQGVQDDPGLIAMPLSQMMFANRSKINLTWSQNNSPTNEFLGMSLFTYFGSGYRAWKGMLRVRAQYVPGKDVAANSSGGNESDGMAMFWSADTDMGLAGGNRIAPQVSDEMRDLATALRKEQYVNDGSPMLGKYAQISAPMIWSDPGANVLDAEVPFYAAEKFKLVSTNSNQDFADGISMHADECTNGTMILLPGGPFKVDQTKLNTDFTGYTRAWVAGGDDFRCGVFLGPPSMAMLSHKVGADTYSAA